ncbi:4-hydroxy-tetrahydrodipicolinate synthase [Prosthecomicrobium pneumaticum]|uniref:4-hydroxy-tetrahydrodipicolinate synthase n=2 Tax=Prosthecomicrobium pneumaticum TaxID=81895 RepID=A0A7W9FKY0_9HYPH|nr:4-hydroxy-tetrahydrodipicolinate synthase [Prosthecomicrobium pneumaticum]
MTAMAEPPFRGVFCAAATPFDADLKPDADRLIAHCRFLLDEGCHGIALLGSTGEANSLSLDERMALLERVVEAGIPPDRLLPGTGVSAYPETVALTRHALSLGVTRVVMLPPFYYKGIPDQGMIDSYARIVEEVADPRLGVIFYHIPPIAQIPIPFPVIEALLGRYPGSFVGIKDSGGQLDNMLGLVERFPGLAVLPGADPLMLPLLQKGGAGCITATSNLLARDLRTVFDFYDDPGRTLDVEAAQARIVGLRTISNTYAQLPTIKALIARRTGDDGWLRVRPPFVSLSDEERASLDALVAAAG